MNERSIQFKLEFNCQINAIGITQKEVEQEFKETIKAIIALAKIYKLELKRDYQRTEYYSPLPIRQYSWSLIFRFEGYGKTEICSYLPRALKYFCELYSLEVVKEKLYFVEEDDDDN